MGKDCSYCGSVLPKGFDDLAYCVFCGKKQVQYICCSHCGINNPTGMLFCLNCGQSIDVELTQSIQTTQGVDPAQSVQVIKPTQAVLLSKRKPVKKKQTFYAFVAVFTALTIIATTVIKPWKYIGGNGKEEIKFIEVSGTKEVNQTLILD